MVRLGELQIPVRDLSVGNFYDIVEGCRSRSSFSGQFIAELERVGPRDIVLQRLIRAYLGDTWQSYRRQLERTVTDQVRREVRSELDARYSARYSGSLERARARIAELHALLEVDFGVSDVQARLDDMGRRDTVEDVKARTGVELKSDLAAQKEGLHMRKTRAKR